MSFRQIIIAALLIGIIGIVVACETKVEQLTPEEVLHHSIQAMKEVQTYAFELDSISTEADMGTSARNRTYSRKCGFI